MHERNLKVSQSRLWSLIEERCQPGADVARIDQRIWDLFGEEWAVMFTDLSGFSRRVEEFGILHFLQIIHEQHKILLPIVEKHDGQVPARLDDLVELPGVGRKTANVVLGNAFGINAGVTVDTHVGRLSRLLVLTKHDDPEKVERDLMKLVPQDDWTLVSHLLIFHGRQVCIARRPRCSACVLSDLCPSAGLV